MTNILVMTMGVNWQIVPEILGFTNPNIVDLYRLHPTIDRIDRIRETFDIQPVDEVWILTANGFQVQSIDIVQKWHEMIDPAFRPALKIFQVSGTRQLASEAECRIMKESILRIVLHASEYTAGGQLILSVTGGHRSMNLDMQFAAYQFGCDALLDVIDTGGFSETAAMTDLSPEQFTAALAADIVTAVTPSVIGRTYKNPLLNLSPSEMFSLSASDFPIVGSENGKTAVLHLNPDELSLSKAISDRLEKTEYLSGISINALLREDEDAGFTALYCLSAGVVNKLKTICLGTNPEYEKFELQWLNQLPKAELFCNLEGVLDVKDLIRVANANHLIVDRYKMRTAFQIREWRRQLDRFSIAEFREQNPLRTLPDAVRDIPEPVSLCAFVQMFNGASDLLEELIYGNLQVESAFVAKGFNVYEALGVLQGIRLLQSEASIRETCRILAEKAVLHGIRYLELRCSPIKYVAGGLNPIQIVDMIEEELGKSLKDFSIVFTAGRHKLKTEILQLVNVAKRIMENPNTHSRLRGFDLAENELSCPAREIRKYFSPIMGKCQHITVNAGANADVPSIWEAVYHLNAERLSQGLGLKDNPALMEEFLDRNLAIEMCPSSDFQIMGFRDSFISNTESLPVYPLKGYLDKGLKVTVNTGNPGISRTNFTRELHRAARLTPGGLSLWEILKIVHNGFAASFADHATRNRLLRNAEMEIIALIQKQLPQL